MIPDEIIRRRIPSPYGYRIPHSEFIEHADPSYLDLDEYSSLDITADQSENINSNDMNRVESQDIEEERRNNWKYKMAPPRLFLGSYTRRIASDQAMIATDIRKYLSSNHVNHVGNSSYFENRRRLMKFTYSF